MLNLRLTTFCWAGGTLCGPSCVLLLWCASPREGCLAYVYKVRLRECTRSHVFLHPLKTSLHVCVIPPVGTHVKMGPPAVTTFRTSWFPLQSYKEISELNTISPARIFLCLETGEALRTPSSVVICCEHASIAAISREHTSALCAVTIARRYIVVHGRASYTRNIARSLPGIAITLFMLRTV